MGVTIVANSEERKKELQEEVNNLQEQKKYSIHAIIHYLGFCHNVSVALQYSGDQVILECKEVEKTSEIKQGLIDY